MRAATRALQLCQKQSSEAGEDSRPEGVVYDRYADRVMNDLELLEFGCFKQSSSKCRKSRAKAACFPNGAATATSLRAVCLRLKGA
jgi:hypothetical protein